MKKLFAILLLAAAPLFAQSGGVINGTRGFPQPNDSSTGTTLSGSAIINSSGNAINAGTSNTAIPSYIVVGGAGTSGDAVLASEGTLAPCTMDSTIASGAGGYYVINSTTTAKECHAQSAAPASGTWVIGLLASSSTTSGSTSLVSVAGYVYGGGLPTSPTTPNGVPQVPTCTPSGGVCVPQWSLAGVVPNPQTGTTYTIQATDRLGYLTFSNASAIAVTLPQAGSTGFTSNFGFVACDIGVGTATITPTTSTISYSTGSAYTSAATSLALTTGQCAWVYSDNTNYFAIVRQGGSGGSSVEVNGGSALTTANFNGSTPAPATGFTNATVQNSGSSVSLEVPQRGYYVNGMTPHVGAYGNATYYCAPSGCPYNPGDAVEADMQAPCPQDGGTVSNLTATDNATIGTGGTSVWTFREGASGSLSNTTVTCTISATQTACSDTTHSFSCPSGNYFDLSIVDTSVGVNVVPIWNFKVTY